MADCNFAGDFVSAEDMCVISVQINVNTDYQDYGCGKLHGGSRVGSLNFSAYSDLGVYTGKPTRAGCQVLWIKKYSCELDLTLFIFSGQGRSFAEEGTPATSLNSVGESNTNIINASSSSGPSSIISSTSQIEGLGMNYTGGPINFNTDTKEGSIMSTPFVNSSCYLQNFHIEFVPGSIPVANYVFSFIP
jgi:hypothetical protein